MDSCPPSLSALPHPFALCSFAPPPAALALTGSVQRDGDRLSLHYRLEDPEGLVHYDIGDCLRSACTPAGEETTDLDAVHFDLDLAKAVLQGYLGVARGFLTPADLEAIPDAIALLPFELGLRFLTDHLAGDVYFRTERPGHNLDRALVQFRLAASVERQRAAIEALVERL